jgi:predicted dehydrogenase
MTKIRMAQYGTRHGHAEGKYLAMLKNPNVEVMGVYEPDPARRQELHQSDTAFRDAIWYTHEAELLDDESIIAVASEGWNSEGLTHTEAIVAAGKHLWYDKPAGDNWPHWQRVAAQAEDAGLLIQMGYMFRYHHGFRQIAEWAKAGVLGEIYSIRAHMSTNLTAAQREVISVHNGGIFYDLGGHMLDQVVWIMGRPTKVTAFLRNDTGIVPAFHDNTLGVFEFAQGLAFIDISAMEPRPMARRYEVYGSKGSAIIVDPFEPARAIRLCLEEAAAGFGKGCHMIDLPPQTRQEMYEEELRAFVATLRGEQPPDRPLSHELLVQETLLRATGGA